MGDNKKQLKNFETLREKAEDWIQAQPQKSSGTPHDMLDLINELRVHQVELEIQNEELQRAQQEISDLQQEYENLYEFAPCGYLTLNHKGMITRINLTGTRLLDTERHHLSRSSFSQFIDRGWEDTFLSARAKSARTGEKIRIELPVKRKNDLPLWVLAEIQADRDDAAQVVQWRVVLLDISERKKAAAALEKSEARYRNMLESISDSLYVCSPEYRVEYMNPAMIKRVERDATGEICYKSLHGLSHACDWCPFDKVRNGTVIENKVVSPLDDRHYHVTHMPVLNDDLSVSKLTIYRDIHDQINAQEEKEKIKDQLYQSQKMESIGTLAGGIAHEINNILSIIIGNNEMASEETPDWSPASEHLEEIRIASWRARDVVKQLLLFSRKSDLKKEPIDTKIIVEETINLIRSSTPVNIEIHPHLAEDTAAILGNPTQISQLLINLCSNAADAIEQSTGHLKIELKNSVIDAENKGIFPALDPGRYVELSISDNGTGMDAGTVERIFDPYFTTKEMGKGTGIGLSVVHGIVDRHRGAIHVDSRVGNGTKFTIVLPELAGEIDQKTEKKIDLPVGQEHILFVDDELSIVKLGTRRLERLGYQVTGLTDPSEALTIFQNAPDSFDLVVTDMAMPKMTGDRLVTEILKIRPGIPTMLCTGYSEKMSEEDACDIGICSFAMKPLNHADFAVSVRKVIDEAMGKHRT